MNLAIVREAAPGETRVAGTPETVRRLVHAKLPVTVQAGAGLASGYDDAAYEKAGAAIVADAEAAWGQADLVIKIHPPLPDGPDGDEIARLKRGAVLVCQFPPGDHAERLRRLAEAGATVLALERIPRITRAQTMDVLSSQATIAGYKAVLLAADAMPRMMPMLMSAAGTVQPAQALVIGAGVAGLQAIATAKRLGAQVKGVDTRSAAQEQVESLGARFVPLTVHHQAEDAGGYATDLGESFYRQEQEILAEHVAEADLIVTTALIPNRKAPVLITEAMVGRMRAGSVIVDLAASAGGNCTLTKLDERVEAHGVTIFGPGNLPAALPYHASQMYARNVAAFLGEIVKDGQLALDAENEIVKATMIVREGEVLTGR